MLIINGLIVIDEEDQADWGIITGIPLPKDMQVISVIAWLASLESLGVSQAGRLMAEAQFGNLTHTTLNRVLEASTLQ